MSNKYLSEFQFVGSSIKTLKIKNDFISLEDDDKTKRKLDVSHSITSIESSDEHLYGTLILNIKVQISHNKKKYNVDLSMEGCFSAPTELGVSKFNEMLQINGVTSLYSIARGFIQSTTSQTLISGNVLLPFFNVAAYSEDLNKKDEK